MKEQCVIIGAARVEDVSLVRNNVRSDSYVICADGGYETAMNAGVHVNLFVGDMDSLSSMCSDNIEKIIVPKEKDETDMMVAVMEGLARGYKDFLILGALGQRFDHTYANLCVLKYICDNKASGRLVDDVSEIFVLNAGQLVNLNQRVGATVSVFPFGCSFCSVSYNGLRYPMKNEKLNIECPKGISNVVLDENASIKIYRGTSLVWLS